MEKKYLTIIFLFKISFCYYSLELNKTNIPLLTNNNYNNNTEHNETLQEYLDDMIEDIDHPLNYSELSLINESYIQTQNINLEQYTAAFYLGNKKQYFRLLLSTIDDYITISSTNCKLCNVSNKYNSILSKPYIQLNDLNNKSNFNQSYKYQFFQDSCSVLTQSIKNEIIQKESINISECIFKVIESDNSGFLNSDLIDGILGLNYNNDLELPNKNFIKELYNKKYISSPSFSIIVTSSNINRFYLGDIMENEYIKNNLKSSINKGDCKIIENTWKCEIKYLEYNALRSTDWELQKKRCYSTLSFDLKDNKLTIPQRYYNLLVISYKHVREKVEKTHVRSRHYNKLCRKYNGTIYCRCSSKIDFGIVTFHFENKSQLDIDLRDYVYYNKSLYYYKCRVNVVLSKYDEFIVGLRGLNNTLLSFNMEEQKIKFFHKSKKNFKFEKTMLYISIGVMLVGLIFNQDIFFVIGLVMLIFYLITN